MQTERLRIFDEKQDKAALDRVCEILKNGGIAAIPTETVYGLAASAYNEDAVKAVFAAKGRPQDNPLIVHISDMEMLQSVAGELPPAAAKCAEKFWPGPFTMVLPRAESIPRSVSAGLDTVAVRMPSNKIARAIIRGSRLPLAAPSANLSGSPSPTSYLHVLNDLDGKIDAVVVSDDAQVGVESTVVSFCCHPPRLLRPGRITPEQLREILPDMTVDSAVLAEPEKDQPVASPGMKYKHYSPKARVILLDGGFEEFKAYVSAHTGDGVYALVYEGEEDMLDVPAVLYGKEHDGASQATALFGALRKLDDIGCRVCYARTPGKTGVELAVYNRLLRAAAFEVIHL